MSDTYDAFEISPVPVPGPDAVPPEPFRGIYGMPAFARIPTADLTASTRFWTDGLGFIALFDIPGTLVHLRRWAFQDVLLVAAEEVPEQAPALSIGLSCVLGEVDALVEACRSLDPGSVTGPTDTPWNTRDIEVVTPERARVVLTAGRPLDPAGAEAQGLAEVGITRRHDDPGTSGEGA